MLSVYIQYAVEEVICQDSAWIAFHRYFRSRLALAQQYRGRSRCRSEDLELHLVARVFELMDQVKLNPTLVVPTEVVDTDSRWQCPS